MNQIYMKKIQDYAEIVEESPLFWDCEDLCYWIEEILRLPEYIASLKKKNINGKKLMKMIDSVEELKKLGFNKIGHRKLLIQQFLLLAKKFHQQFPVKLKTKPPKSIEVARKNKPNHFSKPKKSNSANELYQCFIEIPLESDQSFIRETEGCGDKVFLWKSKEIELWLKGLGLSNLIDLFNQNKILGDILLDLNESSLNELGITSVGIKKKILNSLEKLHPQYVSNNLDFDSQNLELKSKYYYKFNFANSKKRKKNSFKKIENSFDTERMAKKWDINLVCDWLRTIGFSEYELLFKKNEIDGSILFNLSQEDLSDIGIESLGHKIKLISEISLLKKKSK